MARLIVADASALIAYLDPGDVHHDAAIERLSAVDGAIVHSLTLAEVLVHPVRVGVEDEVLAVFDAIGVSRSDLAVDALDLARLRSHTWLKLPDCIVLATARHHGVGVLTFDDRLERAADEPV